MKTSIKEQIKKYQEEFSVKIENSSKKGVGLGRLREELIPSLEKKLSESPNYLTQPLGEFKTSPSGHKYHPVFKSKK